MNQCIIHTEQELNEWISKYHRTLLVCGESIKNLDINGYFCDLEKETPSRIVRFSEFHSNPDYESVVKGVNLARKSNCDSIIAVGGGSSIDLAKCIKLYINADGDGKNGEFLYANIVENSIPFLAYPTTAGSGAEATRYAVIYYCGRKQSIVSSSIIPSVVMLNPSALMTLPLYQKKCTMLDALCHAIESTWSIYSNSESWEYSMNAISSIVENLHAYLNNEEMGNERMLIAAHNAGKAINITQTTAGHAMCYIITTTFGISHGHAAALVNRVLFRWMVNAVMTRECRIVDSRGVSRIVDALNEIAYAMGCSGMDEAALRIEALFNSLELDIPKVEEADIESFVDSVNLVRLANHPIELKKKDPL